jgi:hypothetical protein
MEQGMTNLKMMRIHDELAALAERQAAFNGPSAGLPDCGICATQGGVDRWIEAFRQLPVTAARVEAERELLMAWLGLRNWWRLMQHTVD